MATVTAVAQAETPPIQGYEALQGMAKEATALATVLTEAAEAYPQAGNPMRQELSPRRETPVAYHDALFDLVVRNQGTEQTIDFTPWANNLSKQVAALQLDLQNGVSRSELQDRFFAVHIAYVRTLISTYCFLESAKRQHLYGSAPYSLSESYRQDLAQRLNRAHQRAHRLMRWMHYIRTASDLRAMTQSSYFLNKQVWEVEYGKYFHYLPGRPVARQAFSTRTDLARYFTPVTETATTAPATQKPSADVEVLLKQWEELQKELDQPENRDNAALRKQLEELQKKIDAAYSSQDQNPATDDSATRNGTNDPKLNQLTIRLQGLLAKPEVQSNAALKEALEAFLKELNPNSTGPIKPLPPKEPSEEGPKDSGPPQPPQEDL